MKTNRVHCQNTEVTAQKQLKGKESPQQKTMSLYREMDSSEPGSHRALKDAFKNYKGITSINDGLADDRKVKVIMLWRKKYPKAAECFDKIAAANQGLKGSTSKGPYYSAMKRNLESRGINIDQELERPLWFAIANYDETRGYQFSTVAVNYMKKYLTSLFRGNLAQQRTVSLNLLHRKGQEEVESRQLKDDVSPDPLDQTITLEDGQETIQQRAALRRSLNSKDLEIDDRERYVLKERLLKGLTFKEIARKLQISKARIGQILEIAQEKLAEVLKREFEKYIKYDQMPKYPNIDPRKWRTLSPFEKVVVHHSIAIPKRKDILIARDFDVSERAIRQSRYNAKRKLGIDLPISTQSA